VSPVVSRNSQPQHPIFLAVFFFLLFNVNDLFLGQSQNYLLYSTHSLLLLLGFLFAPL
jgi:hypothetical protein